MSRDIQIVGLGQLESILMSACRREEWRGAVDWEEIESA